MIQSEGPVMYYLPHLFIVTAGAASLLVFLTGTTF